MPDLSHQQHKKQARKQINCGVVTVSDTRTEETDKSGRLIHQLLAQAGHAATAYHIIKDDPKQIAPLLERLLQRQDVEALIINGGTGVAQRDMTFDVVQRVVEKELPGFGELFRMFSYEEIGSAAMLSRALAGTCGNKVLFSVPGSSGAVKLAMEKLILPELPHIVYELNK
ncbi:MAG: MogA/MoaB family molybdenum cofactor biosynthesis protein [SAR324 cluster bacterium]|nr:MogA/MoaB family molybdenum cofactor biosynthesis protein [SAR324 cluster bacterium]